MLTPGLPLLMLSAIVQRAIVQKVKIYVSITEDQSKGRRRRNPEDVRIYFKQLNRCSNALKCQKWTIKKILMLTPGPLVLRSNILMLTTGPLVQQISFFDRTFSSRRRRNHEQKVNKPSKLVKNDRRSMLLVGRHQKPEFRVKKSGFTFFETCQKPSKLIGSCQ